MSTLATLDDIRRILRAVPPSGLLPRLTIGSGENDTITEADAQEFLDAAEDELVLFLGYKPKKSNFVTDLVARMAACKIIYSVLMYSSTGAMPDHLRIGICESAEEDLEKIKRGDIVLPPEETGELIPAITVLSSQVREVRYEAVKLSGTDYSRLSHWGVLPGTLKVYSDRDETTQYTEGTDYEVILSTGEIRRLPGSSIEDGSTVYCTYQYVEKSIWADRPDSIDWKNRVQQYKPY